MKGFMTDPAFKANEDSARSALPALPRAARDTADLVEERWGLLRLSPQARAALTDVSLPDPARVQRHIENFIGTVKLPVGIAGPLLVNGTAARGEYYVPLATSEAALVASYCRGARLITECGGCAAAVIGEGVIRSPGFVLDTLSNALAFSAWIDIQLERFRQIAATTTRHGRLTAVRPLVEANHVYVDFVFETGDAAGQNMVTFATEAVCRDILARSPVRPVRYYIEANCSGDKKASTRFLTSVRGRRVSAEIRLPPDRIAARLHTSAGEMSDYWRMGAIGGVLSGTVGVQGHYANGLAALYIACGQDAACVAESATGITRFEMESDGTLYAAVTLPNLIVGTVGGGTGLPSQQACLDILGCAGSGGARAFAEVCAALALAGELSVIGALCSGEFVRAHAELARGAPRAVGNGGAGHD
jgi:hydroxymethylglutaryl-CoA reductase (NADPH)